MLALLLSLLTLPPSPSPFLVRLVYFFPPLSRTKNDLPAETQLLDAGANPKASTTAGATPIVMAAQGSGLGDSELQEGGAAKCVQLLLDAGVDQTERDEVSPACRGSRCYSRGEREREGIAVLLC